MLRVILALAIGFGALSLVAVAQDKGEKKLTGTLKCTKCSLGETKACGHALIVKEGGKEVTYYLDDKDVMKKYHSKVCKEDKEATVTGKVEEKDGKKHIAITDPKQVEIK